MTSGTRTPRYQEIAEYVRGLVAEGTPGARLPGEVELCQRFAVSRMTVRQALQLLAADGAVHRRPGRGTFIAPRPVPRPLSALLSFTEGMRRRGRHASSRVLTATLQEPEPTEAQALQLAGHDRSVVVLERLRLADGVPMALERTTLTSDVAPVLDADLAAGSLHAALRRLGRVPQRARSQVSARPATTRERGLLEQSLPAVVLCEHKVIMDQYGVPLEHTATCYAAERYVFDVDMTPGDSATGEAAP